jgi:hypothetical protein
MSTEMRTDNDTVTVTTKKMVTVTGMSGMSGLAAVAALLCLNRTSAGSSRMGREQVAECQLPGYIQFLGVGTVGCHSSSSFHRCAPVY